MSKLLGVPATELDPLRGRRLELPMPVLKEGTVEKKSQGAAKAKPAAAKDRFAVVLAVTPGTNNPMASKAVQEFLARRQGPRPGTLQVILVVNRLT